MIDMSNKRRSKRVEKELNITQNELKKRKYTTLLTLIFACVCVVISGLISLGCMNKFMTGKGDNLTLIIALFCPVYAIVSMLFGKYAARDFDKIRAIEKYGDTRG